MSKELEENCGVLAEECEVEQITRSPASLPQTKEKDPKKVAAGKKLAEYNKKTKQKQKLAETSPSADCSVPSGVSWLPETYLRTIIALLGLALTAVDHFLRYRHSGFI